MLSLRRNYGFWTVLAVLFCVTAGSSFGYVLNFELDDDNSVCLDGDWQFRLEGFVDDYDIETESEVLFGRLAGLEDSWHEMAVPCDMETVYVNDIRVHHRPGQKTMVGWFRRVLTIDADDWATGQRLFLRFTGVARSCDIWVNGQHVLTHHGMYDSFDVDVSAALQVGDNDVVLRYQYPLGRMVYEFLGAQDVGHSRPGMGIWGSVYLVRVPDAFVRTALVKPDLAQQTVCVAMDIDSTQAGQYDLVGRIVDAETGEIVGNSWADSVTVEAGEIEPVSFDLSGAGLSLWTLDDPQLYYVEIETRLANAVVGTQRFRFGYRSFEIEGRQFMFNGQPIYLKAMLMWAGHTNRGRTDAESRAQSRKFVERFQRKNCNIVRTAHSFPNPMFMATADELGFLAYVELGNCVSDLTYIDAAAEECRRLAAQCYNYPSNVAYSLGNEVWKSKFVDAQGVLYEAMYEVDDSRAICPVSGGHSWRGDPASAYHHIDFYDIHNYSGHMNRPWNYHQWSILGANVDTLEAYYGQIDKPIFMGETVGMAWPISPADLRSDEMITPARYVELWESGLAPTWTTQVGVWKYFWSQGRVGGPGEANRRINGRIAKLTTEQMRENTDVVQGFCVWADTYDRWVEEIIFADLLASCWDVQRNAMAGDSFDVTVHVTNTMSSNFAGGRLSYWVEDVCRGDIATVNAARAAIGEVSATGQVEVDITVRLTSGLASGLYRLVLAVLDENYVELSRNFYSLFILNPSDIAIYTDSINEPIYLISDAGGQYERFLSDCGIVFEQTNGALPPSAAVGVLSFAGMEDSSASFSQEELTDWLNAGGRLLVDRMPVGMRVPGAAGFRCVEGREMPSVEIAAPLHDSLHGLIEENFFFWEGPFGNCTSNCIFPLTENVLLGKGFDQNTTMALSEFRIGTGGVMVNQLYAAENAGVNASATLYTLRLLGYLTDQDAFTDAREPLAQEMDAAFETDAIDLTKVVYVNLERAANMAFTDEVADDQQGGWTDQGPVHLGMITPGVQMMNGVPFRIGDEQGGDVNTVISLYGSQRNYFPLSSGRIAVRQNLNDLYFLHAAAWCNRQYVGGRAIMSYVIIYEDGHSEVVPVRAFMEIGEWWDPSDLRNALVAWQLEHPTIPEKRIGLYMMHWENPRPESQITSIECRSERTSAVPVVVAITGIAE